MFDILSYDFFIRAIIAALLISIACGVIGTYIVSKRIVFIGGGISHSAFGGIGIAYYFQLNPIAGAAIFAVAVSIVIEYMRKKTRMPIDSLIGIIWSLGMAIGILFVHITPGTAPNLMSYLFGSIYVISYWYLVIMAVLCFTIILFFTLFFKEILYIAFDENYAVTQEIPVRLLNFVLMALLALPLVITIKIVGVILVLSMVTIPQATARLFTQNYQYITFMSIIFGFIAGISGLVVTNYLNSPPGALIILISVSIFLLLKTYKLFTTRLNLSRSLRKNN